MIAIEIPDNPNCAAVDLRVFNDLEPPHVVRRVRLEREPGRPEWYDVTGWTAVGTPCPALARKVDDSGEGVALLLSGGDAGLRLRPSTLAAPWALNDPRQWGESFMILTDPHDLQCAAAPEASQTIAHTHG